MTISTTVDNITSGPYPGDGTNAQFSYTFKAIAATDLQVYEDNGTTSTLLTVNSDYTVNDLGSENGGTIDRVAGNLPTGSTWFIVADYKQVQATVFGSQGAFLSAIHEAAFDRIIMLILQIERKSNLALRLPASYTGDASVELPIPVADRGFKWNAAGTALETTLTNPDEVATSVDASAAAAAVSAAAASVSQTAVAVDLVATNADVVSTGEDVLSAEAWANHDEDVLIPSAVGGDEVDDYSAKHHAAKAEDWANQAGTKINLRNCVQNQAAVEQTNTRVAGFSSTIYTGDSVSDTDIDLNLDMVTGDRGGIAWIKDRDGSGTESHVMVTSVTGATNSIRTDTNAVIAVTGGAEVTSFTSTGVRIGSSSWVNQSTERYVAWAWGTTHEKSGTTNTGRAYTCHYNPKTGLSITLVAAGTSDGSQKIPSHLNQKTELVSSKALDASGNHYTSHESFDEGEFLSLDLNDEVLTTATNDMIHVDDGVILSGVSFNPAGRFLVIQKHSVEGYSNIGVYNPSGEAGYELNLGFRAGYWLGKRLDTTGNWILENTVAPDTFLTADTPSVEGVSGQLSFTDTGVVFNAAGHPAWNVIGSFLYETYAASSTDGTHSQADYDEPTSPDTVNIVEGSIVSFAEGFNNNGTLDSTLTIGASITYTIPNGTPEGKSYLYIDKVTGDIGLTQVPYAEGNNSRTEADHWGTETHDGLRTTDSHSGYQTATGVVSATTELAGTPAHNPFRAQQAQWASASGSFTTGTNGAATNARGYEAIPYTFDTDRVIHSVGLISAATTDTPKSCEFMGLLDGVWVSLLVIADPLLIPNIQSVFDIVDTTAYAGLEYRVYAKDGSNSYVRLRGVEINTSAPVGDFYNIVTGITVDSTDTEIKRVYLATLDTDSEAHASNIENYPVARMAVNDLDVYGFFQSTQNRKRIKFGVVQNNNIYAIPLPDGWDWEDCDAEAWILVDGVWMRSGWFATTGDRRGTKAHSTSGGVVVVTAVNFVANGNPHWDGGSYRALTAPTSALCQVILTNNGRTTNA